MQTRVLKFIGARWLEGGEPPLLLSHKDCGADFHPAVAFDRCGKAIEVGHMRCRMNCAEPDLLPVELT